MGVSALSYRDRQRIEKSNRLFKAAAAIAAAVVVYFAVFGWQTPSDVVEPLHPTWKTTSNRYEFRHIVVDYIHVGSGKTSVSIPIYGDRWVWLGGVEREGSGFRFTFPQTATVRDRPASLGDVEIRNDEQAFYINGVYISDQAEDFGSFNRPDVDRVTIHTNQYGWRTVKPLVMERPE